VTFFYFHFTLYSFNKLQKMFIPVYIFFAWNGPQLKASWSISFEVQPMVRRSTSWINSLFNFSQQNILGLWKPGKLRASCFFAPGLSGSTFQLFWQIFLKINNWEKQTFHRVFCYFFYFVLIKTHLLTIHRRRIRGKKTKNAGVSTSVILVKFEVEIWPKTIFSSFL
jgi:hypothetical protein